VGYQPSEYERFIGQALSPERLAKIWRGLPEAERFGFVLSLDEAIADLVIVLTMPAQPAETEGTDHGTTEQAEIQ